MARAATIFSAGIFLLVALGGSLAGAQEAQRLEDPFELTADRIVYDDERDLYTADGHVRIVQVDRSLSARWVAFSTTTRLGVAEGGVELVDGEDQLVADFMVFDVDTLQGMLFQGSLDAGSEGFKMRARELIRTGRNTFTMRDGAFTTCRCEEGERLPWEIRSGSANVELGGYGTVTNSTFAVLGVPVLWIPWAFFPVKSERETGFLFPQFEFGGRGGTAVGVPFFWAAHPQLNVTLTPRYFGKRGYKQDVEFEYVFGQRSEGKLFAAGLIDGSEQAGTQFKKQRWAVIWEHDQELPLDVRWQTDFKKPSDNLYPFDFLELRPYRAFRFLESTTNFAREFGDSGGYGAMIGIRYADDLQGSTFQDRDDFMLQRFGELRGDIAPETLMAPFGIEARVDSEMIYFSGIRSASSVLEGLPPPPIPPRLPTAPPTTPPPNRTDGRFYDVGVNGRYDGVGPAAGGGEGDGIFQPGEVLADRGTRVVLHPRLARTFQLGGLAEVVPEIGWQQTLYRTQTRRFAERGLFTARTDLRSRLERDYLRRDGSALRHVIEPRLGWAFVSQRRQRSNPLFVPDPSVAQSRFRALSLENVTRNPSDRIGSSNQFVLALNQRFFTRDRVGRVPRLRADILTAIDADFENEVGLGSLYLEARLFPLRFLSSRVRGVYNPESNAIKEGGVEVDLNLPFENDFVRTTRLGVGYRYLRRLPLFAESEIGNSNNRGIGDGSLSQIDLTARVELTARVRLSYSTIYSFTNNDFLRNQGIVEYVSKCKCWGFGATLNYERNQGFGGGFQIRFLGLGGEPRDLFDGGLGTGLNF